MKNTFKRSWDLTKRTFSVMMHEKELMLFPILSIIFSAIFVIFVIFITVGFSFFNSNQVTVTYGMYIALLLIYFGLAVIATFFNFCVVYTAAIRFQGKNAKFSKTIKFAVSKLNLILAWSALAATVGILLKALEGAGRKKGGIGGLLIRGISALGGLAWAIATIFVVPVMVYKGHKPFAAIKSSIHVLKKTWGESLIKVIGMNLIAGIISFVIFLLFLPLFFTATSTTTLFILTGMLFIILFLVGIFFSVANQVFDTALYVYAETGHVPSAYSKEIMEKTFKPQKTPL